MLATAKLPITARSLQVRAGLLLLDASGVLIRDVSDALRSGTVERQNTLDIHGSYNFETYDEYDWANVRFMPYQTLTGDGVTETYYLGVYVPQPPQLPKTNGPWSVQCLDQLSLLSDEVGDTYCVSWAASYLTAVQNIIEARIPGAVVLLDPQAAATVPSDWLVWPLITGEPYTWLGVCNMLLSMVGYGPLWCDSLGRFRAEPLRDLATKAPTFVLDIADPLTDIVEPEWVVTREYGADAKAAINWWRFVQQGFAILPAQPPWEGNGFYTVDRSGGGLKRKRVKVIPAADQATLEAQGDQAVRDDTQMVTTMRISTGPRPDLGHQDVVGFQGDPRLPAARWWARSYSIPQRPSDGKVTMTLERLE